MRPARNRGLSLLEVILAIAILANSRPDLKKKLRAFRAEQEKKIRETTLA